MKIILLNGPPGSGKDFATRALMLHFARTHSVRWERFSRPNKLAFAVMVGVEASKFSISALHTDSPSITVPDMVAYYEQHKEETIPWLGVSYRQWQIDFSERFMKPLYGEAIFAKLFLQRNATRWNDSGYLCFVSDCGFQIEHDTVAAAAPGRTFTIRLLRDEKSFAGDSREYVEADPKHSIVLLNTGDSDFTPTIICAVETWLDGTSNKTVT